MADSINDKMYKFKKASGPDSAHLSINDLLYRGGVSGGPDGQHLSVMDKMHLRWATPAKDTINDELYRKMRPSGPVKPPLTVNDLLYQYQAVIVTGPSTTATAGTPGTWGPGGSTPPANATAVIDGVPNAITPIPTTAWTTGQYMQTQGANVPSNWVSWIGYMWVQGKAV